MRHAVDQHEFAEEGRRPCGPDCQLVTERCECGVARRLRVLDGRVVGVELKLRPTWQWIDVRELLAVGLQYRLCRNCGGAGACPYCRNLGFMEIIPGHAGVAS